MPKVYKCSFCGRDIKPGTGMMYVEKSGKVSFFCSLKCRKSTLILKRDPRRFKWTLKYGREGR